MGKYTKTVKKSKPCAHCGKEFLAFNERSRCCSKICYDAFISESRKAERVKLKAVIHDKHCIQCGSTYTPVTKLSNFCSNRCMQRHRYLANRPDDVVSGAKMSLRGKAQSPDHIAKRMASLAEKLINTRRKCIKCGEEFTPTNAAQKYCSGRCWQAMARKRRPLENRVRIPSEKYNELLSIQNNKCAICGIEGGKNNRGDKLAVDHCHSSGNIRGLLCHKCNTALGLLKDSKENLQSAINYLSENY